MTATKVLAVIPARGGSKGIPRKNLAEFRGKPLLEHTLEAIKPFCPGIDVVVATDDHEIKRLAAAHGLTSDYVRPDDLSKDTTSMFETVNHVVQWAQRQSDEHLDYVLVLQPTSPLRSSHDIKEFVECAERNDWQPMMTASRVQEHPMEVVEVFPDGVWKYLREPPSRLRGRQDYEGEFLFINGAIYGASPTFLSEHHSFVVQGLTQIYVMPQSRSLDIDEPDDLLK